MCASSSARAASWAFVNTAFPSNGRTATTIRSKSTASSGSCETTPATSPSSLYVSVEWNSKVSKMLLENEPKRKSSSTVVIPPASADYFVFPDLPNTKGYNTSDDRDHFKGTTKPYQRIQTVAVCQHSNAESLIDFVNNKIVATNPKCKESNDADDDKPTATHTNNILLVGGNDKNTLQGRLSTIDAAQILLEEFPSSSSSVPDINHQNNNHAIELWGVTDPNNPSSIESIQYKIDAGITSFITQPLFASYSMDILQEYSSIDNKVGMDNSDNEDSMINILVGIAMPRSIKTLHFWADQLIDKCDPPLQDDALFQSHIGYFSQPYVTPMAWTLREIQNIITLSSSTTKRNVINGVHLMPMKNTSDLVPILQLLAKSNK